MMVKNEEINLERCLNSLEELRNEIENELIIIDTGSDDRTVEIASTYTDKIYHHPWNDNFSEMRNISISYANGKWILIIDADEELLNSKELVKQLKLDNEKFDAMAINLVNIVRNHGEEGPQLTTTRVFRNIGVDRYEGVVHNSAIIKGLILKVESTLYHYGYNADDTELMEYKFQRTSRLLKQELDKNPTDIYYLFQLGSSYDMYHERKKAIEYYEIAYNLLQTNDEPEKYIYLYGAYAKVLAGEGKYEKALEVASIGLNIYDDYIDLLYFYGMSALVLKKFDEGIKKLKKYLYFLNHIEETKLYNNLSVQLYTLDSKYDALFNLANCYIYRDDVDFGLDILFNCIKDLKDNSEYMELFLNNYVKNSILHDKREKLGQIYNNVEERNWYNLDVIVYFYGKDIDNYNIKIDTFKEIPSNLGIIFTMIDGLTSKTLNERKNCKFDYDIYKYYFDNEINEVLILLIYDIKNFEQLILDADEKKIMSSLAYLDDQYVFFEECIRRVAEKDRNLKFTYSQLNLQRTISKYIALKNINNKSNVELFDNYIFFSEMQLNYKYTETFLCDYNMNQMASAEEQFILSIYHVIHKNNKEALRKAIKIFPDWGGITTEWIDYYINNQRHKKELNELSELLKKNIQLLIDNRKISEAIAVMNEYLSMNPNDIEMIYFKSEVMKDYL